MLSKKVKLTDKDILEKEFKTSMRGYNPDEVDQFLDVIIKDYEAFHQAIEELQQENLRLKKLSETSSSRVQPASAPQQAVGSTNFDILKRLSNLERHVFGDKLYNE
ncbi:DivIVA domain-containing protein [Bacillus ectoiniformans]|uniref:cell division regulator GpsB n=1 Tax=Bacillus ectoiniformans TaxID=1494429 RepID=UPI0019588749|nr:cell division regulator GpsB [Bacillus ectoiniformans]MBM7647946.1 DivIVA domain-containing protein [Bacillus ectoiniformans]